MFKRNVAVAGFQIGHFIGTADGVPATTGTPTCKRLLDGTPGTLTNAASYDATAGVWKIDLAAGDMDAALVGLSFTLAACLPISYTIKTNTKLVSELNDAAAAPSAATIAAEILVTPANKLATGTAGVVTPSGGTINSVSGTVTLADDGITAAKLADSAIAEIAAAATGATAQQMRDAMLLAPSAGTPAAGSIDDHLDDLAAALAAATSTLSVVSAVDGDVLTAYQAVSFSATISGLAIPPDWVKVWWTVKRDTSQADTEAIIQVVESYPGAGTDGLLRLNGAAGTAANGTLTVSQAAGTVVIDLVDENTDDLALATGLIWSLKALATGGATTLLAVGTLNVRGQATAAVA